MKENFSIRHVPLARDACSCGICFARNAPMGDTPPAEIYELRAGTAVLRLCGKCLANLRSALDRPLPENGGETSV